MKKLLSLFMITLSWVIGMIAVFSFDQAHIPTGDQEVSLQSNHNFFQDYEIEISSASLTVEIPSFKIDWQLFGKLNSDWETISHLILTELSLQEQLKNTLVLFEVTSLFIQFFYPW